MKWKIEYDNDTGKDDGGFQKILEVTNGETSFRANNKESAEWLLKVLQNAVLEARQVPMLTPCPTETR